MILRSAKRFLYYQVEDAVADKFSLLGDSGEGTNQGQDNGSLDEGFFEEFSFDDFDYDDIFGSEPDDDPFEPMKEERKVNVQPATPPVPARKEQSVVTPPVKKPVVKEQSVVTPPVKKPGEETCREGAVSRRTDKERCPEGRESGFV